MKSYATMTSKGQITVPVAVRRKMGLRPGDRVEFDQRDDGALMRIDVPVNPFEKYRGIGNPGMPTGRKGLLKWHREMRGR